MNQCFRRSASTVAEMATIGASTTLASSIIRSSSAHPKFSSSSPVLGLPNVRMRGGRARCSSSATRRGVGPSLLAGVASMTIVSSPVLALVDDRMSTEGTGLSLGLSNNLLGWILLGVFGLIWSLYFLYTSELDEDDDSGLSL